MSLGEKIKLARDQRGWTLEELSEKSGVKVGTISALENRGSNKSVYFPAIARALGMTVEQLAVYDPKQAGTAAAGGEQLDQQLGPELQELIAEWKDIPPWKRGPLLDKIREAAMQSRDERAYYLAADEGSKKKAIKAELKSQPRSVRATTTVRYGDGNPRQLPLVTAPNPFDPNTAPANELAWYRKLANKPKASEA